MSQTPQLPMRRDDQRSCRRNDWPAYEGRVAGLKIAADSTWVRAGDLIQTGGLVRQLPRRVQQAEELVPAHEKHLDISSGSSRIGVRGLGQWYCGEMVDTNGERDIPALDPAWGEQSRASVDTSLASPTSNPQDDIAALLLPHRQLCRCDPFGSARRGDLRPALEKAWRCSVQTGSRVRRRCAVRGGGAEEDEDLGRMVVSQEEAKQEHGRHHTNLLGDEMKHQHLRLLHHPLRLRSAPASQPTLLALHFEVHVLTPSFRRSPMLAPARATPLIRCPAFIKHTTTLRIRTRILLSTNIAKNYQDAICASAR
ncbi:hypothetical protein DFH06DRAFT_1483661 [Mycena polygramma]|nr:hypothetical protein DFH06DRAFT_1483661 [Mycena polygramma]